MRRRSRFAAAALAALMAACSDTPVAVPGGPVLRVEAASGDAQVGQVAAAMHEPLVVRVTGEGGRPVAGARVTFHVTAGGGTIAPPSVATNFQGKASATWTLGSVAGLQSVEARVAGKSGGELVASFVAMAAPGGPARLVTADSTHRAGEAALPLADSLAVRAVDAYGNGIAGMTVSWSAGPGNEISPTSSVTHGDGVARARWTLAPRPGTMQAARAEAPGVGAVDFTATAAMPAGSTLTLVSGDAQAAPVGTTAADPLVVEFRAPGGQPLQGVEVRWMVTSGDCACTTEKTAAAPLAAATDSSGRAAARLALDGRTGPVTVAAQVEGGPGVTFGATKVAGPAAAATWILPAGHSVKPTGSGPGDPGGAPWYIVQTGTRLPVAVRFVDRYGNGVPGLHVTWASGSPLEAITETTDSDGVSQAESTITVGNFNTQVISATAGGVHARTEIYGISPGIEVESPARGSTITTSRLPVTIWIWNLTMFVTVFPQVYATLTMSVEDRSVAIGTYGARWFMGEYDGPERAELDLTGLAPGVKTLEILLVSDVGSVTTASLPFVYAPR